MKPHPTLALFLGASLTLLSHAPATGEETGILGTWRAVELDSGAFKQVEFVQGGSTMTMRVWNSVNGGEMEGSAQVVSLECSRSEAAAAKPGGPPVRAIQEVSFKKVSYTISLTEKALRIQTVNEYTDDSGRGTRESDLFFVRGSYREALTGTADQSLTESGWLGIWKNRDEGTRGEAQITIRDLDPVTMSTWGIMKGGISSRPDIT